MKFIHVIVCLALLASSPAFAADNKYDVLSKALMPFVSVIAKDSKTGNRAMQLTARLEAMTDMPAEFAGARAEIAIEAPDKLRLRGPLLGEALTLCRRGQELWVAPGSKAEAAIAAAAAAKKLPPEDRTFRLAPFELPVPEKQLVFLPVLFRVEDAGTESLDGEECRVLNLWLMPELERSLKAASWRGRLWVRAAGTPARLIVQKTGWQIAVRFERVEFSKSLPASTWQPAPEQAADVLKLTPARYEQLLGGLVK